MERQGKSYAGLCREIDQPANLGKDCAFPSAPPGEEGLPSSAVLPYTAPTPSTC